MAVWTKLIGVGVAAAGAVLAIAAAKKYGKNEPECEEFPPVEQPADEFDTEPEEPAQPEEPVQPQETEEPEPDFFETEPEPSARAGIGATVSDAARAVTGAVSDAAQRTAGAVKGAAQRAGVDTDEVGTALTDAGRALGAAGKAVFNAGTAVAHHAAVEARPVIEKAKDKAGELWQNVRSAASTDESEAAPSDLYAAPGEEAGEEKPESKNPPEA